MGAFRMRAASRRLAGEGLFDVEHKQEIPELPDEKRKRFLAQYSITPEHASSLIYDPHIADYYEDVASKIDPRLSATWIADVLKGELNYRSSSMREASKRISHDEFVTILRYFQSPGKPLIVQIKTQNRIETGGCQIQSAFKTANFMTMLQVGATK